MRAVYLNWFLQRAGYGTYSAKQFKIAEYAVEATFAHAHESGEWQLAVERVDKLAMRVRMDRVEHFGPVDRQREQRSVDLIAAVTVGVWCHLRLPDSFNRAAP